MSNANAIAMAVMIWVGLLFELSLAIMAGCLVILFFDFSRMIK